MAVRAGAGFAVGCCGLRPRLTIYFANLCCIIRYNRYVLSDSRYLITYGINLKWALYTARHSHHWFPSPFPDTASEAEPDGQSARPSCQFG